MKNKKAFKLNCACGRRNMEAFLLIRKSTISELDKKNSKFGELLAMCSCSQTLKFRELFYVLENLMYSPAGR